MTGIPASFCLLSPQIDRNYRSPQKTYHSKQSIHDSGTAADPEILTKGVINRHVKTPELKSFETANSDRGLSTVEADPQLSRRKRRTS